MIKKQTNKQTQNEFLKTNFLAQNRYQMAFRFLEEVDFHPMTFPWLFPTACQKEANCLLTSE